MPWPTKPQNRTLYRFQVLLFLLIFFRQLECLIVFFRKCFLFTGLKKSCSISWNFLLNFCIFIIFLFLDRQDGNADKFNVEAAETLANQALVIVVCFI